MVKEKSFRGGMFNKLLIGLLIVIGIIVIVWISGKDIGIGGEDDGKNLENIIDWCRNNAEAKVQSSYCSDFKRIKIDGVEQYVTCSSDIIEERLGGDILEGGCPVHLSLTRLSRSFCFDKLVERRDLNGLFVNGKSCVDWFNLHEAQRCESIRADGFVFSIGFAGECGFGRQDVTRFLGTEARVALGGIRSCCVTKLF